MKDIGQVIRPFPARVEYRSWPIGILECESTQNAGAAAPPVSASTKARRYVSSRVPFLTPATRFPALAHCGGLPGG